MSHDSHGGHGDHPEFLQHHFDTPHQQFSAAKLGMWLFLAQEILFFGGLFCWYATFRYNNPEVFSYAHHMLDWKMGALNTVVLLISSLTMALGVRAAQLSNQKMLLTMLAITFACAGCFMVVKYFEYSHKAHLGFGFGRGFQGGYERIARTEAHVGRTPESVLLKAEAETLADRPLPEANEAARSIIQLANQRSAGLMAASEVGHAAGSREADEADLAGGRIPSWELPGGERPANVHVFFNIYYCLTGLHGIHVLAGMVMLIWLFWGAMKGKYNKEYFTPVDLGGLYWHLVDLVWIYLFPLLYLIGP